AAPRSTATATTRPNTQIRNGPGSHGRGSAAARSARSAARDGRCSVLAMRPYLLVYQCLPLLVGPAPQQLDFGPQPDTGALENDVLRAPHQRVHVVRRSAARVDNEVGVLLRNLRAADCQAFESNLFDQPARVASLGVGKDAARRQDARLRAHTLRVELLHSGVGLLGRARMNS